MLYHGARRQCAHAAVMGGENSRPAPAPVIAGRAILKHPRPDRAGIVAKNRPLGFDLGLRGAYRAGFEQYLAALRESPFASAGRSA